MIGEILNTKFDETIDVDEILKDWDKEYCNHELSYECARTRFDNRAVVHIIAYFRDKDTGQEQQISTSEIIQDVASFGTDSNNFQDWKDMDTSDQRFASQLKMSNASKTEMKKFISQQLKKFMMIDENEFTGDMDREIDIYVGMRNPEDQDSRIPKNAFYGFGKIYRYKNFDDMLKINNF